MPSDLITIWIGVASVIPLAGSEHQRQGLSSGYGFVAMRAETIEEAVKALRIELLEGGSDLTGFEWVSRIQDYDQILNAKNANLVKKLDDYPVQFSCFHWHTEKPSSN